MYITQDIFVIQNLRATKFLTPVLSNSDTTHFINTNILHDTVLFMYAAIEKDRMAELGLEDKKTTLCL
jgi:Ni,Fe-hydrogenase III component G